MTHVPVRREGAFIVRARWRAWSAGALPRYDARRDEEYWVNCYGLVLLRIARALVEVAGAPLPYITDLGAG